MADERIQALLREIAPAAAELRDRWGVTTGLGCPGGCDQESLVTWDGFPQAIAGDLWQVRCCPRCMRAEPIRFYELEHPLPVQPYRPEGPLWLRTEHAAHLVHMTAPGLGKLSTLRSACGWPQPWPDTPVCSIRFAYQPVTRCGLCERATRRAQRCEDDAIAIWGELVRRALEAIAADGHRDPWGQADPDECRGPGLRVEADRSP